MKKAFLLLILPLLPLLTSCDKKLVNAQLQAGAWHITSLRVQTGLAPGAVQTVSDAGDAAFTAVQGDTKDGLVRFYFDKPLPVRPATLALINSTPLGYLAEAHEQNRVILTYESDRSPDISLIYTLTESSASHQHWQLIRADNQERVTYREDWDLDRL